MFPAGLTGPLDSAFYLYHGLGQTETVHSWSNSRRFRRMRMVLGQRAMKTMRLPRFFVTLYLLPRQAA